MSEDNMDERIEDMEQTEISGEKKGQEHGKYEFIFAPLSILGSYFLVECGIFHLATVFMTLAVLAVLFICRIYMTKSQKKCTKQDDVLFGVLCIFALAYGYTSNWFICFLVTMFEVIGICFFCYRLGAEERVSDAYLPFALHQSVFQYPFKNNFELAKSISAGMNETKTTKGLKYSVTGLVLTIPLTFIVASLLMSADDGVAEILQNLGSRFLPNIGQFIWKFILSLILACMIFGMLYTSTKEGHVRNVRDSACEEVLKKCRIAPSIALCAGVLPICLLYGVFFYSQANYLLAAFAHRLPEGFSYANYARQGFFELCVLALINLSVITAMHLLAEGEARKGLGVTSFTMILCVFTLFLLATAFRKMVLYIERFGLTPLRFYTSWFMVLITVVFILIMLWRIKKSIPLFRFSMLAFVIWFALLVFSRPDNLIARYNYGMYEKGVLSYVDYTLFENLSDDAWGYLGTCSEVPEKYRKGRYEELAEDREYYFNISSFLAYWKLR